MNIVAPESLVFWTTVIFIVFFLVLKKLAWKPILGAVKEREDSINKALESAEEAKKEMQSLNADNERILKEARAERDSLLKDAREIKEKMISEAKEDAQEQAGLLIKNAKAAIEVEKQAAIADLKTQVAKLSIDIAEKVVRRELASKEDQLALVDKMLGDVTLN